MLVRNKRLPKGVFASVCLWRPQPNRATECSMEM